MPFAAVAVNAAAPIKQTFTYSIPEGVDARVGHAVYVPFGTRTLQGVVMGLSEISAFPDTREIEALIDPKPLLSPAHAELASWLSEHYLAPLFDCVSLMLPPGFKRKPLTILSALASTEELPSLRLTERQAAILRQVIEQREVDADVLRRRADITGAAGAIAALLKRGFLHRSYRLARPQVSAKMVRQIRLVASEDETRAKADGLRSEGSPRSLRLAIVIEALADEGVLSRARAHSLGLTAALQRELESEGMAAIEDVQVVRDPLAGREFRQREPAALTVDQERAFEAIAAALEAARPGGAQSTFLLHGVTGSGKTEVYLAALDQVVAMGKRAIVLVPEISLTPQTLRRFGERFPGRVAVMHSGLSPGEHFDMWHQVREGRYAVVVGPRSALFAPQPDVGLVVIDEEHEWTYKQQEGSPRYHARRAAEELCRLTGSVLVLGSATPDVESRFRAQSGSYRLLELPQRLLRSLDGSVAPGPLPQVEVVDLRAELKAGNRSIFSRSLADGIGKALEAREQVILFLNRRGTASFVQCRDCGHVPGCRTCAVSLTYHEPERALVCHHCRRRMPMPAACPQCGESRIRMIGLGTERVEEEVKRAFPSARTLRWDRDVTKGRDAHEAILSRFLAHEADVLVGTQMIAKGLDIPLVTLVGVISADISLHIPDFRSGERTFQLLEQVAGRAGRGEKGGRVVVQTYTPQHFAIKAAAAHDYAGLYESEMEFRQQLGYPPFGRLVRLTYAHSGAAYSEEQAMLMVKRLKKERDRLGLANVDVLGPAPGFVARIRGRWRWNVIVRGSDPVALVREMTLPRGWTVDVDPATLL